MKLPVAYSIGTRDSSLNKDPLMRNALAEPDEERKVIKARKRPAIDSAYTIATGVGQGLFTWTIADPDGDNDEVLVGISDDIVNTAPTPINKALRFVVQPSDPPGIGEVITPAVTVEAIDRSGTRVTSFAGEVTIAMDTNPTGATLGGDTKNNASSGLATFNDLELSRSGADFTLSAAATGLRSATSDTFTIATKCVFTTQPVTTEPETVMANVVVTVRDLFGNTDTAYNGDITLTMFALSGSGELSGTTTKTAASGVATFNDLEVSAEGTYEFRAEAEEVSTAYPPALAFSSSFQIATFSHVLVAANDVSGGTDTTGLGGFGGSLTPTTFNSVTITDLATSFPVATPNDKTTVILMAGSNPQAFFTSLSANGKTLLSSAASYTDLGVSTIWAWTGTSGSDADMFTATGTIPVTIA